MGIYDRDHRQNDPWKKKNDSFEFNESKGEIEIDQNSSTQTSFKNHKATKISEEAKAFNTANKHRRIQKQFDDQQKIKLKEFKQTWKINQNKNLIWVIPWVLGLLMILAISKEIHKHNLKDTNIIAPASTTEESIFEPLQAIQSPATSIISSSYTSESATCPFTMIADNKNYYIKLCDTMREDQTIAKFFVRAGEKLSIKIPAGNYKLKYGAGEEWYGEEELFGPFNQYGESEVIQFIDNGYSSSGHTVSFYQTVNGNFHTNNIGRDSVVQD